MASRIATRSIDRRAEQRLIGGIVEPSRAIDRHSCHSHQCVGDVNETEATRWRDKAASLMVLAIVVGEVLGDGRVAVHHQMLSDIGEATAGLAGRILGDGCVGQGEILVVDDAAAVLIGGVAAERRVGERHRAVGHGIE